MTWAEFIEKYANLLARVEPDRSAIEHVLNQMERDLQGATRPPWFWDELIRVVRPKVGKTVIGEVLAAGAMKDLISAAEAAIRARAQRK